MQLLGNGAYIFPFWLTQHYQTGPEWLHQPRFLQPMFHSFLQCSGVQGSLWEFDATLGSFSAEKVNSIIIIIKNNIYWEKIILIFIYPDTCISWFNCYKQPLEVSMATRRNSFIYTIMQPPHPRWTLYPLSDHDHFSSPWQPIVCLLSLWFWTFQIKGII